MRVVGLRGAGPVAMADVGHGMHPFQALLSQGWAVRRPLSAHRAADGEIELVAEVESGTGDATPRAPGRDTDLVVADGEMPVRKQRVAAYGLIRSSRGLLATEYSGSTSAEGQWGLPGGGVEPGEEPAEAVRREVWEETAQTAIVHDLFDVQSAHWIGRSPRGVLEDYHAIRLVYRGVCEHPTDPAVLDVGGTTADAAWVAEEHWPSLPWTHGWAVLLRRAIGTGTSGHGRSASG